MTQSDLFTAGRDVANDAWPEVLEPASKEARWDALFSLQFKSHYIDEMGLLDHYERMPLIWHWYEEGQLEPEELNRLLSENWTHGGYIFDLGVENESIVEMLEIAGFITDTPDAAPLSSPATLFRGCKPEGKMGFSWSQDPTCAAWFARRMVETTGIEAVVCKAVVLSHAILGRFEGRAEREVVVDTRLLDAGTIVTIPATNDSIARAFYQHMPNRVLSSVGEPWAGNAGELQREADNHRQKIAELDARIKASGTDLSGDVVL